MVFACTAPEDAPRVLPYRSLIPIRVPILTEDSEKRDDAEEIDRGVCGKTPKYGSAGYRVQVRSELVTLLKWHNARDRHTRIVLQIEIKFMCTFLCKERNYVILMETIQLKIFDINFRHIFYLMSFTL